MQQPDCVHGLLQLELQLLVFLRWLHQNCLNINLQQVTFLECPWKEMLPGQDFFHLLRWDDKVEEPASSCASCIAAMACDKK